MFRDVAERLVVVVEEEHADLEEPVALQMQWEFESGGDGWEAFAPRDQQALALAYSTGQKKMMLNGETGQRQHSYRLDLQRMVQMNMDSGRERKLRRLPAGRLHSGLDAVRLSEGVPNRPPRSQLAAADSRLGVSSTAPEPRAWSGIGFEEDEPEPEPQAAASSGWMAGGDASGGGDGGGPNQRISNDLLEMAPWCEPRCISGTSRPFPARSFLTISCSFVPHRTVEEEPESTGGGVSRQQSSLAGRRSPEPQLVMLSDAAAGMDRTRSAPATCSRSNTAPR